MIILLGTLILGIAIGGVGVILVAKWIERTVLEAGYDFPVKRYPNPEDLDPLGNGETIPIRIKKDVSR